MKCGLTLLGLAIAATLTAVAVGGDPPPAKANKYVGAEKCKNCHEAKDKGSQYSTWKGSKHSQAFDTLGSDEAKKIGKEKGIDDPQKSEKCLKCHTTAFGEPAGRIATGFDPKNSVQCESCHGPGENHFKARMASEDDPDASGRYKIAEDEIIRKPQLATCLGCHNPESPKFKPFCMKAAFDTMKHFDLRVKRTDAELKEMKCACGGTCKCEKGECGGVCEEKK